MEWVSEIFSDQFSNSCAQTEHIILCLRHLTDIVHVARIGSPFGLFATHTGCVDVVEYVSLNSKIRLSGCSHLSGATAADTVIPTFPAKIINAANTTIIFFILFISLVCFPFLPQSLFGASQSPAANTCIYPIPKFYVYSYHLPSQWNHPSLPFIVGGVPS